MKNILLLTILAFSIGTLWGQDAPAPAAPAEPAPAAPAAAEPPVPAAEEGEARWSDFLPLNKEMAGDADLPLPFGIGVTVYSQDQIMRTDSIAVTANNLIVGGIIMAEDPAAAAALFAVPGGSTILTLNPGAKVKSDVETKLVRLDAWILPFLNVYGIAGEVEGDNTVSGASHPTWASVTAALTPFPAISYEGDVYGIGGIIAFAHDRWWGTLDYSYTKVDISISTSEITTKTFSPRVGTTGKLGDLAGTLWIGGMHQKVDEHQTGATTLGGLPISYDVLQHAEEEWNFLIGGSVNLSEEMDLAIEAGVGDRESFMGSLTFRF